MRVFSLYAPTNCPGTRGNDAAKGKFWRELRDISAKIPAKTEALYLGDLNSTTTLVKPHEPTRFGKAKNYNVDFTCNENGEQLTRFCAENGLGMLNSYFYHSKDQQITHRSNLGNENANKTLDYALATQILADFCIDCRIRRGYLRDTILAQVDHYCVVQRWRIPYKKCDRRPKMKKSKPSPDLAALKDSTIRAEYQQKLTELAEAIDATEAQFNEKAQTITDQLNHIAKHTLPKRVPKRQNFPWRQDEQINTLKRQRGQLIYNESNKPEFRRLSKQIKNRANALKRQFWLEKAEEINLNAINRDLQQLFRNVKNHDAFNRTAAPPATRANFKDHFRTHFNKEPPSELPIELEELPEYLIEALDQDLKMDELSSDPPSKEEIILAVKKLKCRKASDDVAPELLKAAIENPAFLDVLHRVYEEVWNNNKIPDHWRYARLKALFKEKGSADDAGNYRGISVGSTQLKILCVVILTRMRAWYEGGLSEGQFGFRANRGCQDAIYGLKRVQQIYHEKRKKLYVGFIDLKAAFDWVPRDFMFKSIRLRNTKNDPKIHENLTLFEDVHAKTYNYIDGDSKDEAFRTTSGVRQGGVESPSLTNLYLDFMVRIFEKECKDEGLGINIKFAMPSTASGGEKLSARELRARSRETGVKTDRGLLWTLWLGFADDLAILAESEAELNRALELLYAIFMRFGLLMSLVMTETMIITK